MANSTAKYLNGNQLIRMREIFNPFFKVLEECCTSYAIYKCTIEAEVVGGESRVKFDFKVSDERGTAKVDTILYVIEEDCFYVKDSFKFEKGSERKVNNAIIITLITDAITCIKRDEFTKELIKINESKGRHMK